MANESKYQQFIIEAKINSDLYEARKNKYGDGYVLYINNVEVYRCKTRAEVRKMFIEYIRKNNSIDDICNFKLRSVVV